MKTTAKQLYDEWTATGFVGGLLLIDSVSGGSTRANIKAKIKQLASQTALEVLQNMRDNFTGLSV